MSLPNIVKINSDNRKVAPMTTMDGCRYRHSYVLEHFQSKYHQACKMAINVPSNTKGSIEIHVRKADEKLVSHVTKLLFAIYVDANKLTSSAYSWPARFVGAEAGRSFDYRDPNAPTIHPAMNLQYVNPTSHADLLSVIVESDKPNLITKLQKSIAASIRIDGSVNRTQIDEIYVMLKIITADGQKELIFIGIAEQNIRGAPGLFEAVKRGIIENFGEETFTIIMMKISSICTDGTNMNSGEKGGLWALFEDEIRRIGSQLPLRKVWCSAHRMELVWGDVCKSNAIIENVLNKISSISSYFHKSAIRMSALKKIAAENNLPMLTLPKLFEIRWTEFSHTIINNLLRSWYVLMLYFDVNKETNATDMGYFRFLSKIENLRVITFIADLLQIYSRYQKKSQDDKLTINSLVQNIRSLQNALIGLQEQCLFGGWEETFSNSLKEEDEGKFSLKGFELSGVGETCRATENTNEFSIIRNDIIG